MTSHKPTTKVLLKKSKYFKESIIKFELWRKNYTDAAFHAEHVPRNCQEYLVNIPGDKVE